ncbi:Kin of IRRE-like protein 1 [Eufriesea mexicana]|uniref:Kin of IRRE-like protein 1 n=1 Tax=Eufriesea mexicana TaxID=516756 RepID=A0A310SEK9_9HYME|nr:Kin of IRRE-like protein 1 [Eufriesea mexicana]
MEGSFRGDTAVYRLNGWRFMAVDFRALDGVVCIHSAGMQEGRGEVGQYFRVRPRNSSVLEGGEVTIPCEVGNRVGIVQWVKDGFAYVIQPSGEIVGHPRLRLIGDQNAGIYNLKITDASLTDDGEYQCQVGPYLRIKAIRANAHLIVICRSVNFGIFGRDASLLTEKKDIFLHVRGTEAMGAWFMPLRPPPMTHGRVDHDSRVPEVQKSSSASAFCKGKFGEFRASKAHGLPKEQQSLVTQFGNLRG